MFSKGSLFQRSRQPANKETPHWWQREGGLGTGVKELVQKSPGADLCPESWALCRVGVPCRRGPSTPAVTCCLLNCASNLPQERSLRHLAITHFKNLKLGPSTSCSSVSFIKGSQKDFCSLDDMSFGLRSPCGKAVGTLPAGHSSRGFFLAGTCQSYSSSDGD